MATLLEKSTHITQHFPVFCCFIKMFRILLFKLQIFGDIKTKGPKQDIQNRLRSPIPEGGNP
jgi:hypothetical protein